MSPPSPAPEAPSTPPAKPAGVPPQTPPPGSKPARKPRPWRVEKPVKGVENTPSCNPQYRGPTQPKA